MYIAQELIDCQFAIKSGNSTTWKLNNVPGEGEQESSGRAHLFELFTDSDWAGSAHSRKSTSAGILCLNSIVMHSHSRAQKSIALSSCEAELLALTGGLSETLLVKQVWEFLVKDVARICIRADSSSARQWLQRSGVGRLKHYQVRLLWTQKLIQDGSVDIKPISTKLNIADLNTKKLSVSRRHFLLFFLQTVLVTEDFEIETRIGSREFFEHCNSKLMIQTVQTAFARRFNRYNLGTLMTIGLGLQGCNQSEREVSGIISLLFVAGICVAFASSVIFLVRSWSMNTGGETIPVQADEPEPFAEGPIEQDLRLGLNWIENELRKRHEDYAVQFDLQEKRRMVIALVSIAVRYDKPESRRAIRQLISDLSLGSLETFPRSSGSGSATDGYSGTSGNELEVSEDEPEEDKKMRYRWCSLSEASDPDFWMAVHHGDSASEDEKEAEEAENTTDPVAREETVISSSEEPKPSGSKRFEVPEPEQEENITAVQNESVRRRVAYARALRDGDTTAEPEQEDG